MSRKSTPVWQKLKGYPAGKRFELFFNHRKALQASLLQRCFIVGSGIFLMIAGFIFLPTPVPGILLLFFGASLLAQESLIAARVLDWAELRVRAGSKMWSRSHISLKVLITLSFISLLCLVGVRVYLLLF